MQQTPDILTLLAAVGALITDSHIVYTSGKHGSAYVNKDALYPHTRAASLVGAQLAGRFAESGVEVVAGPTIGGVIMAQWVAHHLERLRGQDTADPIQDLLAIYAEEQTNPDGTRQRVFRRGYADYLPGKRVLVVEDVLTTGQSAQRVIAAVREAGGVVVGVGALCNRSALTAEALDVPRLESLVDLKLEAWDADACPLCKAQVPINTTVGKGAAFLASRNGDGG